MAFWGVELKSTKPYTHSPAQPSARLRISQATLGFGTGTGAGDGRIVVQCNVGDKTPVLLCSLLPDKAESCPLDLEFDESEQVTFSVIGPRSVHLTGYYLPHSHRSLLPNDDSESFGEDVGITESSDYNVDEDEYEDSFIDDGDLQECPSSPSPDSKEFKKKTKKEKSDVAKIGRKRLKKKFEVSDSTSNNSAHDPSREEIVESDEVQVPISSKQEGLKRKMRQVDDCTANEHQSEDRKVEKKKKKRKIDKENSASGEKQRVVNLDKDATKSATEDRKTMLENGIKADSDGLLIEDIVTGDQDGKVASAGKKVTIHYTGMLKTSGKVFDSSIGRKPLKFRLGEGIALDGMDRGIVGMRVGGKRKLIIPPSLGYGSDSTDRVPANSWLIMEVELLRVHK